MIAFANLSVEKKPALSRGAADYLARQTLAHTFDFFDECFQTAYRVSGGKWTLNTGLIQTFDNNTDHNEDYEVYVNVMELREIARA